MARFPDWQQFFLFFFTIVTGPGSLRCASVSSIICCSELDPVWTVRAYEGVGKVPLASPDALLGVLEAELPMEIPQNLERHFF